MLDAGHILYTLTLKEYADVSIVTSSYSTIISNMLRPSKRMGIVVKMESFGS